MKKLSLLAVLFAALLIILFVARTDSQTPLTANDLGQVTMPPQTVLGNTLPVPAPLNAVPFSQLTGAFSFPTILPPVTNGHCLEFTAPNSLSDAGAPCNTGGGGGSGTVTSVGASVPTGLSVTGSPITTSGTLTFGWSGTIPNAQIPSPSTTALGGVLSATGLANQFMTGITTSGAPIFGTPIGTVSTTGSPTSGNCAQFTGPTTITSVAAPCGSGGGSGTVTSVAATVPTGLAVSGSPITTSGTLGFTWSGTIPNAQIPAPTVSTLGGVESVTCPGGQFVNGVNTSGIPGCSTPSGGGNVSTSGTINSGNCAQWNSSTTLISIGAPCGSGGGGTNLGYVSIATYATGPLGDGTCHQLSSQFGSLAAAQAIYPFVSDLTQCIDWAAAQQAVNVAFSATPTSAPIFCPAGQYQLSLPVFVDAPNNSQGAAAAWVAGTTYGNAAAVKYNGINWTSNGSGNIGNPPTATDGFPGTIHVLNVGGYPLTQVAISNASPAIISYTTPGFVGVIAGQGIVFQTQNFNVQPGNTAPALPTGINPNQVYYVLPTGLTTSQFEISATPGGAAINTTSAGNGAFYVNGQTWSVTPVVGSNFSNRITFIGEEGIGVRCNFTNLAANTGTIYLGPQNNNLIKSIGVTGLWDSLGIYRCNKLSNSIGFEFVDINGGPSNSKFENINMVGFYSNFYDAIGSQTQGDTNQFQKVRSFNSCVGINMAETQTFINSIYDGNILQSTVGIMGNQSNSFKVVGGNYSTFSNISTSFAVTGVTTGGSGCGFSPLGCVSMTVTAPDQYLGAPTCSMNAGAWLSLNARWGNSWPAGNGCGYNVFTFNTAHHGVQAFNVVNYNQLTKVLVLAIPPANWAIYAGNVDADLATDVASMTTLYAAEMVTPFFGNIQAESFHIEQDNVPTTVMCVCTGGFALSSRPGQVKDVLFDSNMSIGDSVCCNSGANAATLANFYAQQSTPIINGSAGSIILEALSGGQNFFGSRDRVLIAATSPSYLESRHNEGNLFNNAEMQMDFISDPSGFPDVFGGSNGQLSGQYMMLGASATGGGVWDNAGPFASGASYLNYFTNPLLTDQWRIAGFGSSPTWGVRPAPWTQPCVLPGQVTTLQGALPAITHTSQLSGLANNFLGHTPVTIVSGGTGYTAGDVLTISGVGGAGTAATLNVVSVAGGVITSVSSRTGGSYTTEPTTPFTVTGGTGSGATFANPVWNVFYTITYPTLWGGQNYRICSFNGSGLNVGAMGSSRQSANYSVMSTNTGYSYFQNLTTTNVPNLTLTQRGSSPFFYMNQEAIELMFPGLVISLTGGGSCSGTQTFMVMEEHPSLGYIKVVRADNDGSNYLPTMGGTGVDCTFTTIGQAAPNLVYPY